MNCIDRNAIKRWRLTALLLLLALFLPACGPSPPQPTQPPPAASPRPTETSAPPPTVAPTAAPTPAPTTAPTAAPTPPPALRPIVYERGGNIWLYDGTTHQALTNDRRSFDPLLSPDGGYLLFYREEEPTEVSANPRSLWVYHMETAQESRIDLTVLPTYSTTFEEEQMELPRWPAKEVWLPDGRHFLFNTYVDFSMVGPGSVPEDDLWSVDAQTGQVRNILPGGEGAAFFSLHPEGQWVLLNRPTRIDAFHLENEEQRTLLEFPFVPTYSEYAWLPEPHWLPDGRHAHVAIGPAEPLESVVYTLWRIDLEGAPAEQIGQVTGSVFAWSPTGASWSPDGSRLLYVQETERVMLANADGSEATEVASGDHPQIVGWSPDGQIALYQDQALLLGVDIEPQPTVRQLAEIGAVEVTVRWRGEELFVATAGQLLQVATDGSGVEQVNP